MTHKKLISKSELDNRIAKADIKNLECRQQHFGIAAAVAFLVAMGIVIKNESGGDK